jgi:dihydrofolate synthase/folylpolyglutamate synthase
MEYEECLRELYSLVDYERLVDYPSRFDLSSFRIFLEGIDSPHEKLNRPIIITGTKGKGSTAEILSSCLRSCGHRVGIYTSPHLVDVRERIRVNGERIPEEEFLHIYEQVKPFVRKQPGGYRTVFEVLTAISFVHFGRQRTDYSIFEVGMGGRNDATNVVNPTLSIVTPISLDHTHVLGGSIEMIAEKKMGVARPGVPVVSSAQSDDALKVIRSVCERLGSDLMLVGTDVGYEAVESDLNGSTFAVEGRTYSIPLLGEHQVQNSVTAYLALKVLGQEAKESGFRDVTLKGRLQVVGEKPSVVLDAAHNGHSAAVLAKSLRDLFGARKVTAVISMLKKKDHEGFARELSPVLDEVYATRTDSPRSLSPDELAGHFKGLVRTIHSIQNPKAALREARAEARPDDVILVTGSFYLVGEILSEVEVLSEEIIY